VGDKKERKASRASSSFRVIAAVLTTRKHVSCL
jgi:hypothetical protein